MTIRRTAASLLAGLLAVTGLTACGTSRPDPQAAADALAAGLATEAGPDLGAQAATEFPLILGELAENPRSVIAGEVVEGEGDAADTATVPLTWTIELGDGVPPFTYETEASLTLTEGDGDATPSAPQWIAAWNPALVHPQATATTSFAVSTTSPERADIITTGGAAIVTEWEVWDVGIDKTRLDDPAARDAAARQLAEALGIDPETYAGRVASAGESAFVIAITIRQSDGETWGVDALAEIPGVLLQEASMPLGPTATWARPVLGAVGEATAEIIETSEGEIEAGDLVGLSGLQAAYDEQLRGTDGVTVTLVEAAPAEAGESQGGEDDGEDDGQSDGGVAADSASPESDAPVAEPIEVYVVDPVPGEPLVITLDPGIQDLAEAALADVQGASAIAVVRPSTGEVLALASGPGSEGYSTATLGQYAPGSTFKIATALALLRAGYSPEDLLHCTPTASVDGRDFQNYPGYPDAFVGDISFRTAIAQSCNAALINEAGTISAEDLEAAAASLGIGAEGTWAFPYFSGSLPADATGTAHAAALIGQGGVLVSPLAMAGVAASVAAGHTVVPVLLPDEEQSGAPGASSSELTAEESAVLGDMMREVVTSGTSTVLAGVPGEPVHAKSGTAEYEVAGEAAGEAAGEMATHGWMIAYQGDLAVAVFVETTTEGGAGSAGVILAGFLTAVNGG